ncbi:MAG: hypothetical protein MI862_26350 [Desulfobacterales bacterium]|nr:hypothetical protein [Desulfobacterales bacterium]
MKKWLSVKNGFAIFLVVWFAYGVWESISYAYLAKVFPFYVSLVLLVFAVVNIVLEVRKTVNQAIDLEESSMPSDVSVQWNMPMADVWKRFAFFISLILVLYGAIYFIGYPVAMSVFIGLFYSRIAKASLKVSAIAGLSGFGFLTLASKVLGMDWPKGLIQLPWPFG